MKVREYDNDSGNGFRQVAFYFYGKRNTYKAVLNFAKRTVRIAVKNKGRGPQWLTLQEWEVDA